MHVWHLIINYEANEIARESNLLLRGKGINKIRTETIQITDRNFDTLNNIAKAKGENINT